VLGYLFAFPLPPLLGLPVWSGVAGLTASAGIAGWVEFYLLRRSITQRIGRTGMPISQLAKLWGAGIVAGLSSFGVMRLFPDGHPFAAGVAAMGTFALVYGAATVLLRVPEATLISSRVLRRR
jgi:putative peptidoglycan lipid II flippase